jgi:hypothetical protein
MRNTASTFIENGAFDSRFSLQVIEIKGVEASGICGNGKNQPPKKIPVERRLEHPPALRFGGQAEYTDATDVHGWFY